MHVLWKFCIFIPLVKRTNSSHVWICFVIAGNGFRISVIASNSTFVDVGWACRRMQSCLRPTRVEVYSQFPVCRPDVFKISRKRWFYNQQRPASTHFKFKSQRPHAFWFKSDQTCNMCRSFLFLFGFHLSLIWCTGSGNRWMSSLEVRDHFWRCDMISYQSESHLSKLANHAWLPWNPDLRRRWCRMDLFPKKNKTRELRVSLPARLHLKSPGWPFRQVCESFPYSIHSLIDLTDFNVLRLRYWSYIYFQKVDEDISANETSWNSISKYFYGRKTNKLMWLESSCQFLDSCFWFFFHLNFTNLISYY